MTTCQPTSQSLSERIGLLKVQQVGQVNTVTKSDFTVPVMEGLYGYC